jgi:hypothetical protein
MGILYPTELAVTAYIMPNDEEELDRLDVHHHIALLHLDGELYLAPIGEKPSRILDLGTGTDIWAIDMGKYTVTDKI